jgi:CubicO group peptidase (beta-lactamase class C family)
MEMITKNKWVLHLIIVATLIFLGACENSSKDSSIQVAPPKVKPTATMQSGMKQSKPETTIKPEIKQLNNKSKILEKRTPIIFSTPDRYDDFPKNIQDAFKQIVDTEFSELSEKAGISVAVYTDGILWTYSSGKASESVEMTENTPLMISSTSKTFLSALILTQIEKGLYKLSDPIESVLYDHPDFSSFDTTKINTQVTVDNLLNMSSGMANYSKNMQGMSDLIKMPVLKQIDLIDLIQSPYDKPGSFEYNDTNVVLLGMIAELHSGQRLSELYRKTFYEPLSITAITLPEEGIEWHSGIAKDPATNFSLPAMGMPYTDISRWASSFGNMIDAAPFEFGYYIGAMGRTRYACCGIISTPQNIARWAYHLYSPNGLAISESVRIQLKNSTSPTRIPPWSSSKMPGQIPAEYGYLVSMKKFQTPNTKTPIITAYGHPGGGSGYSGTMHYSPELDLSISIITNSQMKVLGTCSTAAPGDCITMEIFKSYMEQQLSE